ncbi:MAG TPA: peptidoglycan-binding domain-containing protein [Methylomirabilota bacterium]|nr:peptidoglycan-binding domain-containing protein [Methylomirabilota bacterium]
MTSYAVLTAFLLAVMSIGALATYIVAPPVTVGLLASASESRTRSVGRQAASLPDSVEAYRERLILAQEALRVMGYRPGPVDGVFRPQTAASLRAFQREQGIQITGRLTAETLEKLGIDVPPTRLRGRRTSPLGLVIASDQQPLIAPRSED